jgi:hypothetical protein
MLVSVLPWPPLRRLRRKARDSHDSHDLIARNIQHPRSIGVGISSTIENSSCKLPPNCPWLFDIAVERDRSKSRATSSQFFTGRPPRSRRQQRSRYTTTGRRVPSRTGTTPPRAQHNASSSSPTLPAHAIPPSVGVFHRRPRILRRNHEILPQYR